VKKLILILGLVGLFNGVLVAQSMNPTQSINAASAANNFRGGYTFSYATAGTPWNGALLSFGGLDNNFDCQISSDYGPNGGGHLSFRTRKGDASLWNSWNEIATRGGNVFSGNQIINDNVGIGIANPTNKLDVNGTIHSKEVKVDMIGWSDFVFKKEYNLPSLEEVEKHIAEKGHLENIPSEEEVLKNGINLGEMNAKLLQKIEELTLYVIEMKKENEIMKNDILKLKQNK